MHPSLKACISLRISSNFHCIISNRGKMILSFSSVFICPVSLLIFHILLLGKSCSAKKNHLCPASSCGEVRNISYPFRLKGDPKDCGSPEYELACENNRTVLYLFAGRYYVKSINYDFCYKEDLCSGFITVVDDGLQKGNCSTVPRYSLTFSNFSVHGVQYTPSGADRVAFVKCSQPITSASYVDTKPCIDGANSADTPSNVSQMKVYSYVLSGSRVRVRDVEDSCTITMISFASDDNRVIDGHQHNGVSPPYKDFHNVMADGFDLWYHRLPVYKKRGMFSAPDIRDPFCLLGFRYRREGCIHNYFGERLFVKHFVLSFFFLLLNVH